MWFSCLTSTRLLKLYGTWIVRMLVMDDAHGTFDKANGSLWVAVLRLYPSLSYMTGL